MNQILCPDKSAPLWYDSSSKKGKKQQNSKQQNTAEEATESDHSIAVNVGVFGYLSTLTDKTRVTLNLPGNAKVGDAVKAIGEACGEDVRDAMKDESGDLAKCCRIFVNGEILDDVDARLLPTERQANIEIIILMADAAG